MIALVIEDLLELIEIILRIINLGTSAVEAAPVAGPATKSVSLPT